MIENLEQICIAFYQRKNGSAYQAFQSVLPSILKQLEADNQSAGIPVLHRILNEVEKGDFVMVADIINFELIPILQEGVS